MTTAAWISDMPRHGLATRLLHGGVALAVIWQLAAMALIVLFWANLTLRRIGTEAGALFPWASAARRAALWADTRAQLGALTRLRLPHYVEGSGLASAVHGLGLVLMMTLMAASGTAWWFTEPSAAARVFENVHKLFANLAWVYLIAHAGLGVLHHLRGKVSLSEMWSLRDQSQGE